MFKILVQASFGVAGTIIGWYAGVAIGEELEPEVRRGTRWMVAKLGGSSTPAERQMRMREVA